MNAENNTQQSILDLLQSEYPSIKTEVLYNSTFEVVDSDTIKMIVQLILDEDKGVRNAASNFLIKNNNPLIPYAILDYTGSTDISVRNLAGEILLKKGVRSVKAICERLPGIKDDDDIKFLVDILGLIEDKTCEDLIIEILMVNQNENVIVACIESLGNMYSEKAIDTILPFYDKTDVLKPVVIEAAGKIKTLKSLKFITEKFNCDDDLLKFTMIESMGEIGDEATFYFLLSQLDQLSGALVWPLLEAIYKLKVKFDLDIPFDERVKKCVLDTILNSEPQYQIIAAHLVTVFDDPETLFACLSIYGLNQELNEVLHEKFMNSKKVILNRIHNVIDNSNKYLPTVLELLQNIIQSDAKELEYLTGIEKRKLTDSLSNCLTNPDEIVRITSAELLFSIDQETTLLFLDTMINDENIWNRVRLLDLLVELDNPIAYEALERLSNDPEEMVSEKAKEMALRKQYFTN